MESNKSPQPADIEVGQRIRAQRLIAGMSQTELADQIGGITFQQIQKYERGANRVSASRLRRIAEVLKVPPAFLLDGSVGSGPPQNPEIAAFLRDQYAMRLMRAFNAVIGPEARADVVVLVERMGKLCTAAAGARASRKAAA